MINNLIIMDLGGKRKLQRKQLTKVVQVTRCYEYSSNAVQCCLRVVDMKEKVS